MKVYNQWTKIFKEELGINSLTNGTENYSRNLPKILKQLKQCL